MSSSADTPQPTLGTATRWLVATYSVVSYIVFLGTFLALIAFVGDIGQIRSMDRPFMVDSTLGRVAINGALALLFGIQHSVMARGWFKEWITRYIPEQAERSTFLNATNAVVWVTLLFWQPMTYSFFSFEGPARIVVWTLFGLGFAIVLASSFMINHFHLFGLEQGYEAARGAQPKAAQFYTPLFYRWVRHPLMTGMLLGLWAMTDITVGRLLVAGAFTVYILIGVKFEERSLTRELGDIYLEYKKHVPSVIPGLRPGWPPRKADANVGTQPAAETA